MWVCTMKKTLLKSLNISSNYMAQQGYSWVKNFNWCSRKWQLGCSREYFYMGAQEASSPPGDCHTSVPTFKLIYKYLAIGDDFVMYGDRQLQCSLHKNYENMCYILFHGSEGCIFLTDKITSSYCFIWFFFFNSKICRFTNNIFFRHTF
jgi:hypothetical protein